MGSWNAGQTAIALAAGFILGFLFLAGLRTRYRKRRARREQAENDLLIIPILFFIYQNSNQIKGSELIALLPGNKADVIRRILGDLEHVAVECDYPLLSVRDALGFPTVAWASDRTYSLNWKGYHHLTTVGLKGNRLSLIQALPEWDGVQPQSGTDGEHPPPPF